jgi:hypothetical protein
MMVVSTAAPVNAIMNSIRNKEWQVVMRRIAKNSEIKEDRQSLWILYVSKWVCAKSRTPRS